MNEIRHMTHKNALALIAEYQKTKDYKLFEILLAKYDELLLKCVYEQQRMNSYMRRDPLQELYHIAISGFTNVLKVIPAHENPHKIPAWIKSYVRHAFDAAYKADLNDRALYRNIKNFNAVLPQNLSQKTYTNAQSQLDATMFLNCKRLTDIERKVIKMHFMQEMTLKAVSHEVRTFSLDQVRYIRDCAIKKLRACHEGKVFCKNKCKR